MTTLEDHLSSLELRVAAAQKAGDALTKALRRLRAALATGHVAEIDKALLAVSERSAAADAATRELPGTFSFDTRGYLSRRYVAELKEAAEADGLPLVDRDGKLYSFPLFLRIEPDDLAVRVGRKLERRIRPKEMVRLLKAVERKPQRFNPQRFLDLVFAAYQRAVGASWKDEARQGPLVKLTEIYEILTLFPGVAKDYPEEEFARDLLLLDRARDTRTKNGLGFLFAGSSSSRGSIRPIRAYDESGAEHAYYNLRFDRGV